MAHFAQLNESNVVTQVIVVHNNDCTLDGVENETVGVLFCKSLFGTDTKWKQTSYNDNMRKNYAGIGYIYDAGRDAFIPPQPFVSWVLEESTCTWGAPVPYPTDEKQYRWDEPTVSWVEVANAVI
jgi:hypothetical protein